MANDSPPARLVKLEGCFNFRDLGGYAAQGGQRLRWRRLFRSDALHHMTPSDLRRVREEIGLRTIVDLRSSAERSQEPRSELGAPPVREHHVPLFDRERSGPAPALPLDELYFAMLQVARAPIADVMRVLVRGELPAVVHCAAGKDRTGLVSAVLLSALGVSDADVIEDYAATRTGLVRIVERVRGSSSYASVFVELPPETLTAEPETMARLLERVSREFGSMRGYLLACGLDAAELQALERALLEQAPG
jgi:protein tyrosine/serine phosphatase